MRDITRNFRKDVRVFINGEEKTVIQSCVACGVWHSFEGVAKVRVEADFPIPDVEVGPKSENIEIKKDGNAIEFEITNKRDAVVWLNGHTSHNPLILYLNEPYEKPMEEDLIYFEAGKVHDAGEIVLKDNQTLYIEAGAYVYGRISATNAKNIKVIGSGILDPSLEKIAMAKEAGADYSAYEKALVYPSPFGGHENAIKGITGCYSIKFIECENVLIDGLTILNAPNWITVIQSCEDVVINRLRETGKWVGTDGMDIVSSKRVRISNCTIINNDDCVVIKAFPNHVGQSWANPMDKIKDTDVRDILVENCIFMNGPSGNAIEVGHELRTESVENIVFRDTDVLTVHGSGAALSVHNGDRALVKNVVFEDIRIEHVWDKVFDFRVMKSVFNHDDQRGQIRNILVKNVQVMYQEYNYGYTVSLVSGYDKEHTIENVKFEDVYITGEHFVSPDQIDMCFRHEKNVEFI